MPRFISINFYQNKPKSKLFLLKNKIFRLLGAPPPDPQLFPGEEPKIPDARNRPFLHIRFLGTRRILYVCRSYFQILESNNGYSYRASQITNAIYSNGV